MCEAGCTTSRRIPQPRHVNAAALTSTPVWALPFSLAATGGINHFFSSCGYLDVSVLRVRFSEPMYSVQDDSILKNTAGFPHSEIFGSQFV